MGNCWLNIRIGIYHWQITFDGEWSFQKNEHWCGKWYKHPFCIYDLNFKRMRLLKEQSEND